MSLSPRTIVTLAVLTAMAVLLSYVFQIYTPFVRVTFGFLPIALAATHFGPLAGGLVAAVADLIGTLVFAGSIFFPGFTFSAFLTGGIYGVFFYRREVTLCRVAIAFLLVAVLIHLGLNTFWLVLYYDKAAGAIFLSRLVKNLLCYPMEVFLFYALCRRLPHGFFKERKH